MSHIAYINIIISPPSSLIFIIATDIYLCYQDLGWTGVLRAHFIVSLPILFLPKSRYCRTIMLASRVKPKLSLDTSVAHNSSRSILPDKSPVLTPRTPGLRTGTPISPATAGSSKKTLSPLQMPAYQYMNSVSTSSNSKSILKKHRPRRKHAATDKRIHFTNSPIVYFVTPIENPEDSYGSSTKLSREERRWIVRE